MNKFSKQLYLATVAVTLATNLAESAQQPGPVKQDTSTRQHPARLPGRRMHHPSIFYSDGIEVMYLKSSQPLNVEFRNNHKMNRMLEKAVHEAGAEGFVYLLKLNDTGLYKLIYGNARDSASFAELKLEGPDTKIFSEGQVSMKEVCQSPLIQRIFAQLKSADPMAIKAQMEALLYVRGEEQRARIADRALQNLEMMEQDKEWLYKKPAIKAIKRLLTKLHDFKPLNEQDKQELDNLTNDLDQRFKAAQEKSSG
jgi:hypothetical protein